MKANLTGYTFRKSTARPSGQLRLKWEEGNKYDAMAIGCYFKEELIGYLKKGSDEQKYAFDKISAGVQPKAVVID